VCASPFSRVSTERPSRGFTLVEILVALAIVAVALAAGLRAVAQASDGATLLKQRTLALWVAQDRLALAQIASPTPEIGTQDGATEQAGSRFAWRQTVSSTPNPAFRKIDIVVSDPAAPAYALAMLSGYLGRAP